MADTRETAGTRAGRTSSFTGWLISHGRRSWTEIHGLLNGCTCAWADIDGFHAEHPPADPPLATHLWAWREEKLLRIRVDGSEGITAELRLTDSGQGEPVIVIERNAASWRFDEGRVSVRDEWRDRALKLYRVQGLMPLEFAHLKETGRRTDRGAATVRRARDH